MADYVAGLFFSFDYRQLALVRKNRPAWQAGRLNAIGGHIEPFDKSPLTAMTREFVEETTVYQAVWREFAIVSGIWGNVHFFTEIGDVSLLRDGEDEHIEIFPTDNLPYDQMIPNLKFLIPLAMYRHNSYEVVKFTER